MISIDYFFHEKHEIMAIKFKILEENDSFYRSVMGRHIKITQVVKSTINYFKE